MVINRIFKITAVAVLSSVLLYGCGVKAEKSEGKVSTQSTMKSTKSGSMNSEQSNMVMAADFTLKDMKGTPVKLSDYKGKIIILDFWATWCPPCVKEIPHFNDIAKEWADKDVVVLGVSVDRGGAADVNKFTRKTPIDYPVLLVDGDTYQTYQSYLPRAEQGGIPFTFVIDKSGAIREHFVGYRPKEVFEEVIRSLM